MVEKANDILKPQLRFPEFGDSWKVMYGNEVFCQISKRNDGRDLPLLAISQDFGAVPRQMIDYNVVVSDQSVENYKIVEVGDFIISLRSFQGGIEYSNYNGLCSPAYIIIRKKIDIVDLFFKHYFKTYRFIAELNKNLEGLRDGKMISWKQFSEIKLKFPSIPEQQKIADCLSSIDEMISRTQEKIDLLRQYKKGLMQKMFPAKGKNLPELRFKEFENNWKKMCVGEIGTVHQGYGFPEKYQGKSNGKYPFYKVSDISNASVSGSNYINESNNYIDDYELDILKAKTIPIGTIIFAKIGEALRLNRRVLTTKECLIDNNVAGIKADEIVISDKFLLYTLYFTDMNQFCSGVVPSISKSSLENIEFLCPSVAEQNKIVSLFSLLDEMVENQINKLELLKLHKKGMMQKLFPIKY